MSDRERHSHAAALAHGQGVIKVVLGISEVRDVPWSSHWGGAGRSLGDAAERAARQRGRERHRHAAAPAHGQGVIMVVLGTAVVRGVLQRAHGERAGQAESDLTHLSRS